MNTSTQRPTLITPCRSIWMAQRKRKRKLLNDVQPGRDCIYPSPPPGQGAPRARIGRRRGRRKRRRRSRKDGDVELHAKPAVLADRADEPPPAGLVQREAVLAGAPDGGGRGLVARLEVRPAQLHHVVGALAVLERCKGLAKSDNLQMHGVARSE